LKKTLEAKDVGLLKHMLAMELERLTEKADLDIVMFLGVDGRMFSSFVPPQLNIRQYNMLSLVKGNLPDICSQLRRENIRMSMVQYNEGNIFITGVGSAAFLVAIDAKEIDNKQVEEKLNALQNTSIVIKHIYELKPLEDKEMKSYPDEVKVELETLGRQLFKERFTQTKDYKKNVEILEMIKEKLATVVGMGAVVAATTHGPLQAILIIFEMTGDYKIILPLMITCIISCIVARKLCGESIYTFKLIRRGINIRGGKEVNILSAIPVKNVMYHTVEIIPQNFLLKDLAEKLPQSRSNNFVVVDENEKITGVLTFLDYYDNLFNGKLDHQMTVADIMTKDVVTVSIEDNLSTAFEKITAGDYSILPVVSADDSFKLAGILTRRDILEAYDQAVIKKAIV